MVVLGGPSCDNLPTAIGLRSSPHSAEMPHDDHERRPEPPAPGRDVSAPFILLATVAFFVARIPLMPHRVFDPDEFEHSHAAWSLFKGLVPYRDFFEHHTPWYYLGLSPFFRWFPVDQSFEAARRFLLFGRLFSSALAVLSVLLVVRVGRLIANRGVGLLAGLFVAAQPVFIQKTLEIRPDVPAFLAFMGALWFLLRGLLEEEDAATPSLSWFLGGGLCLGAAIMCTQKMLFVLPGAFLGLGVWALAGGRQALGARMRAVLVVAAGVVTPALLTWSVFAILGGGRQFIYNNFLLNARFQLRSFRGVQTTFKTSWPILVLALLGASVAVSRFCRARRRQYGDLLLLGTLGGLVAGVALVPVVYEQYCLVPLSIACLFAARGLSVPGGIGAGACAGVVPRLRDAPPPGAARSQSGLVVQPPKRPAAGAAAVRLRAHRAGRYGAGRLAGDPAVSSPSALLLLHAPRAAGRAFGERQGCLPRPAGKRKGATGAHHPRR